MMNQFLKRETLLTQTESLLGFMEILTRLTKWIESQNVLYEELSREFMIVTENLAQVRLERDNLRSLVDKLKSEMKTTEPTMIGQLELLKNYDRRVKELTSLLTFYQSRKDLGTPHRQSFVDQGVQTDDLQPNQFLIQETPNQFLIQETPPQFLMQEPPPPRISIETLEDQEAVLREIDGVQYAVLDSEPHYVFSVSENQELIDCVGYYRSLTEATGQFFFYDRV